MGCSSATPVADVYTVEYFDGFLGRAEPLMVCLHTAKVPYAKMNLGLPKWKMRSRSNKGEFPILPNLYFQGQRYQQAGATLRMLGVKFGFYDPADW